MNRIRAFSSPHPFTPPPPLSFFFSLFPQGASLEIRQAPSLDAYRILSCKRLSRPCQNSILSGFTRKPPQNGGQLIGRSLNRPSASSTLCSSSALLAISSLCGEAHAPIWLPRGRV